MQAELEKNKISIPFNELLRNNEYRENIKKVVRNQGDDHLDILEVTDDYPSIILGHKIEERDREEVPPFYLILNVHDMIWHNAMLYSGASHNLMPRVVVKILGLDITRHCKDLYSFDS